jgi:hypothetical protein
LSPTDILSGIPKYLAIYSITLGSYKASELTRHLTLSRHTVPVPAWLLASVVDVASFKDRETLILDKLLEISKILRSFLF